jgi:conjugative transfer region protein (TIGR03750 family)
MPAGKFFDDDPSAESTERVAPLTDRVNCEPPIMRGLSASETLVAFAVFFPAWMLLGLVLAFLFRTWQVFLLLGVIGPLVSVWVSAGFLASYKRNRPDHYYLHAFKWWRHRLGLGIAPFIHHHGPWEIGRSLPPMIPKPLTLMQRFGFTTPAKASTTEKPDAT